LTEGRASDNLIAVGRRYPVNVSLKGLG